MDKSDHLAAHDLYKAYSILSKAIRNMKLPTQLLSQCTSYMCQYIERKNGFFVKGIGRAYSSDNEGINSTESKSHEQHKAKKIKDNLQRETNKEWHITALIAALIYVTTKKLGLGRSFKDLCIYFDSQSIHNHQKQSQNVSARIKHNPSTKTSSSNIALKPLLVSKAVTELKNEFPQLFQSMSNPAIDAANLVQHVGEKLKLPSAAIGCIRALALHCGKQQVEIGRAAGSKPSLVCAAVTHFICRAAGVMQRLAKQAILKAEMGEKCDKNENIPDSIADVKEETKNCKKRQRIEDELPSDANHPNKKYVLNKSQSISLSSKSLQPDSQSTENIFLKSLDEDIIMGPGSELPSNIYAENCSSMSNDTQQKFDALSSAPVISTNDDKELEILQGWFSWSNQRCWSRDLSNIGNACDIRCATVLEYYKKFLHPYRSSLLTVVQDFLTSCQDADVCYLVSITAAAPLMILGQ